MISSLKIGRLEPVCLSIRPYRAGPLGPILSSLLFLLFQKILIVIKYREGDRFLEACNLNREWPEGRGIFHNDAKTFLVWVNEED